VVLGSDRSEACTARVYGHSPLHQATDSGHLFRCRSRQSDHSGPTTHARYSHLCIFVKFVEEICHRNEMNTPRPYLIQSLLGFDKPRWSRAETMDKWVGVFRVVAGTIHRVLLQGSSTPNGGGTATIVGVNEKNERKIKQVPLSARDNGGRNRPSNGRRHQNPRDAILDNRKNPCPADSDQSKAVSGKVSYC